MVGDEAEDDQQDADGSINSASVHGRKRTPQGRPWRHPLNGAIEVPYRVAAAVAVMEMGISEYGVIAEAVGLTVEDVRRIEKAEDSLVRQLAVAGIPVGEFFKLDHRLRCPRCQAKVEIAPCVVCHRLRQSNGPRDP